MLSAAAVAAGLMAAGCHSWGENHSHGDPCWPDRYANETRAAVVASFQPQVENGHILDQTVWNLHFEYGSDKLNGGGHGQTRPADAVAARSRTRSCSCKPPATSRYDAEKPNDYADKRVELDTKRVAAVQKYLKTTLTGRETAFDIQIHDPVVPGHSTVNPGVEPRVYVPTPQERARGSNVPSIPVTGVGGGGGDRRRSRSGRSTAFWRQQFDTAKDVI